MVLHGVQFEYAPPLQLQKLSQAAQHRKSKA